MTNEERWNALNVAIDKDGYGGAFDPTDYEDIARVVNMSMFKRKLEELYKNLKGKSLLEALYSSKFFRNLITIETLTPSSGVIDLGSDLAQTYGEWVTMTTGTARIKLVTHEDKTELVGNAILAPDSDYPIAVIDGDNLTISPTTISSVSFTYLKKPTEPIFDYYSDSDDNIVYMTAGATGVSIPSGATYYDGTAGPVSKDSRSVEFVYDSTFDSEIFTEMLQLLTQRIRDPQIDAYSERQQLKQDAI